MRATKLVVRPGRKNGGTTLVFTLRRPGVVRFTVVRLYPTCERVGSFTVHAGAGTNRIRFKGRVNGRPLADGVYRVLAQVRGHEKAVAAVTLIVARRKATEKQLRRPRTTACSSADARAIEAAIGAGTDEDTAGTDGDATAKGIAGAAVGMARRLLDVDGPIGQSVGKAAGTIEEATRTIPPALFAIAALAVLLLTVASMPQLGGLSRTEALLVHKRTSFALAGGGALVTAIMTYLVLLAL